MKKYYLPIWAIVLVESIAFAFCLATLLFLRCGEAEWAFLTLMTAIFLWFIGFKEYIEAFVLKREGETPWIRFIRHDELWALWIGRLGILKDDGSPPLFSEWHGYTKAWRFWGIKIKW